MFVSRVFPVAIESVVSNDALLNALPLSAAAKAVLLNAIVANFTTQLGSDPLILGIDVWV